MQFDLLTLYYLIESKPCIKVLRYLDWRKWILQSYYESKFEILICPLKADTLSLISFCSPIPVEIDTSITITDNAIATIPIFIIGADILLL